MTKLKVSHYYLKPDLSKEFKDTCESLGLSRSAIVSILISQWLTSKEFFLEAKRDLIRINNLKAKKVVDK